MIHILVFMHTCEYMDMLAVQVPGCGMSMVEKLCGQGHSGHTEHYWETGLPCPSGHAAFPQAIHVRGLPA